MSIEESWPAGLVDSIECRIDLACRLYQEHDRAIVLSNIIRALHRKADILDASGTWLHIALGAADVPPAAARRAFLEIIPSSTHPSVGDAEDIAEDLSRNMIPGRADSPLVSIRAAVQVAWIRFAPELDETRRALLAAEAARMA